MRSHARHPVNDGQDLIDSTDGASAPDNVVLLAQAFDVAWTQFASAEGPTAETEDNRRRLARQLVGLSRAGEKDIDALARAALTHLPAFAVAMRISRRQESADAPATQQAFDAPGAAFGPDAVNAMREALELCLEDLPLRLPPGIREALLAEIMSDAAQGERDPRKLSGAALAALERRR